MKLEHRTLRVPTARPFKIAAGTETEVEVTIVEIAHEGHVGRGEAAASERVTGETRKGREGLLEWARGEVAGLDPAHVERFLDHLHADVPGNPGARCAIDLALHDLAGKSSGTPVHAMYGLPPGRIETTMTVSLDDPAAMAAEALDYWSRGFACIKVKLGDARRDLERLAAIRRAVPRARLRADANASWSWEDAYAILRRMPEFGVELVEQPLPSADEDGLVMLARESPVPIFLDESALDAADVRRFARKGFRGGFNFKLQKAGGIRPAVLALREARASAYGTQLGCNLETGLAITAATHLVSLLDYADLDGNLLLARDPFDGARCVRGWLETPTRPGIGAEPRGDAGK